MMPNIYDQHQAAFAQVSAYVIAKDGAGRLYAYVHWLGLEMVRGYAGGGGYDKRSAACSAAARRLNAATGIPTVRQQDIDNYRAFIGALTPDDGWSWDRRLQDAGFTVWQAV